MWRRAASSCLFLALGLALLDSGCGDPPTLCCDPGTCPKSLPNDGDPCSLAGVVVGAGEPACAYCSDPTADAEGRHEVSDLAYCRNGVFEVEGVSDVECSTQ